MFLNRNLITAEEHATTSSEASGIFDLQSQSVLKQAGRWPAVVTTVYEIVYSVTVSAGTYTLRGGYNDAYTVDWGDGTTTSETTQDAAHTYASSGTYSIKLDVTGTYYYPKFWGHTSDAQKINSFVVDAGANLGTSLFASWENASNLTTFTIPDAVMTSVTDLRNTWAGCSSLTSFPLLSIGNVATVNRTWYNCTSLASMPSLDYSSCTDFFRAWRNDTSLTTFPANAFDSTGTLGVNAFNEAFQNCALTAQSIENILTSLDTNGAAGVTLDISNGTNANVSTWSSAAITAYNKLVGKGWNIAQNGEVPSTLITNGLVLNLDAANANSYSGSGTAWNDVSGNNNHGTLTNGPTFVITNGGSIVFDGTNDYVAETSALSDSFLQGDWTISFWVKVDSVVTGGYSVQRNLLQHGGNSTNAGLSLTQRSSSFALVPYSFSALAGSTTVSNNTWYNVVFTHNSTSYGRQIYLNGALDGSNTATATYAGTGSNARIGGMTTLGHPLDGNIAIVLAYNRVLTATEILQNYNLTEGRFA